MSEPSPLRCGVAILARFEPRLLGATLASIRASSHPPAAIAVVVPRTREHLYADIAASKRAEDALLQVVAPDDDVLQAALNTLAPAVDISVIVPEGVVLDAGFLTRVAEEAAQFEDLVAVIELVNDVTKIATEGEERAEREPSELKIAHQPQDPSLRATLRAFLAARSLLGSVFWVRNAVLGQIRLAAIPDLGEPIAYALALDELSARGRTAIRFTRAASQLRLIPERRSGYEAGYQLYRRLYLVGEAQQAAAALRGAGPVHLRPGPERFRLALMHGLRALTSPANRHHAITFLQGALAARHDVLKSRRKVRHDLREIR